MSKQEKLNDILQKKDTDDISRGMERYPDPIFDRGNYQNLTNQLK